MTRHLHAPLAALLGLAVAFTLAPSVAQAGRIQVDGVRVVPTNPDPVYDVFLNIQIPAFSKLDNGDVITLTHAPGIESLANTTAITPPSGSPLYKHVAQSFQPDPEPGFYDAQLTYFGNTIDNSNSANPYALSNNNVGYRSVTVKTFTLAELTAPIYWYSQDITGQITDSGIVIPTVVPEPGTCLLAATAIPALALFRSRWKRRPAQPLVTV